MLGLFTVHAGKYTDYVYYIHGWYDNFCISWSSIPGISTKYDDVDLWKDAVDLQG